MLVGYARVSSETIRQNTDLQLDALIKAGVDERNIFQDKASGAKTSREGLDKALAFLKPGDCLVVWKLDRLGCSLSHLVQIVTELKERGVAFRSISESHMDTTTPNGELLFGIFATIAQYERSLNRERIMAGLEAAKKRGKRGGRPRAISEEQMEAVLEAIKSGKSKAAISRNFGIARTTLHYALLRSSGA